MKTMKTKRTSRHGLNDLRRPYRVLQLASTKRTGR